MRRKFKFRIWLRPPLHVISLQLRTSKSRINPGHCSTKVRREQAGWGFPVMKKKQIAVCEKCSRSPRPVCRASRRLRPRPGSAALSEASHERHLAGLALRPAGWGRGLLMKKLNSNKYGLGGDDDTKALFSLCANAVPIDTARFPWGHFVLTSDPGDRGELWGTFGAFSPNRAEPPGEVGQKLFVINRFEVIYSF